MIDKLVVSCGSIAMFAMIGVVVGLVSVRWQWALPENWWLLCCGMAGPVIMVVILLFFQGMPRDDDL